MNPNQKMARWEQFTERIRKKYVAREEERDRARSPEARERHKLMMSQMMSDLQSAVQKELFKRTRPLPSADHVIDAAEQLMKNEHE